MYQQNLQLSEKGKREGFRLELHVEESRDLGGVQHVAKETNAFSSVFFLIQHHVCLHQDRGKYAAVQTLYHLRGRYEGSCRTHLYSLSTQSTCWIITPDPLFPI
jgi:hypothetical protein